MTASAERVEPAAWRAADVAKCAVAGLAGTAGLLLLFPGGSLSRITHRALHLPGPGSGVCAFYGPLVILCALLAGRWVRKPGAALCSAAALGLLHSVFTPILFPGAKTVGTVGPLPLRVLGVLVLGAVLEYGCRVLNGRTAWLRNLSSAAAANLALLLFYWSAVYPLVSKRPVRPASAAILILIAVLSGALLGGCLPALLADKRPRRGLT